MISYLVYEILTGKIIKTGVCQSEVLELQANGPNEIAIQGRADQSTQFIKNGNIINFLDLEILVNKTEILCDGEDSIEISNIPEEITSVFIDDEEVPLEISYLEFTSITPGIYKIKIDQFPYKYWEQSIEVLE